MRAKGTTLVLLVALCDTGGASGQPIGFGFHYHSDQFHFSAFAAGSFTHRYHVEVFGPFAPVPYGYCPPPIVVVVPPPLVEVPLAPAVVPRVADPEPRQFDEERFIVIRPRPPGPPPDVEPPPREPAPIRIPRPEPPEEPPFAPRDPLLLQPAPKDNPVEENARLVALGKEAFAARQYGLAAERFRRASAVAPQEALAHFLLGQAYFALGKFDRAVAPIRDGLELDPDWPTKPFTPRELYGPNVDEFDQHLQRLQQVVEQNAENPTSLFLLGYQQWFSGQREEARDLFRQAAGFAEDPALIQHFLAVPGEDGP